MDIDAIKKKVLEDVDPETKRKIAHARRVQRLVITLQSIAVIIVVLMIFLYVDGHIDGTGEFDVSDIA